MFAAQASRFTRDDFASAAELGKEIAAVLGNSQAPLHHQGPLRLVHSGQEPAITIVVDGGSAELIRFENPAGRQLGSHLLVNGDYTVRSVSQGANNSVFPAAPGIASDFPNPNQIQADLTGTTSTETEANNLSYVGIIASGSGTTYDVVIYPDGFAVPTSAESVTAENLADDADDVPVGTKVQVTKAGDEYHFRYDHGSLLNGAMFIGRTVSSLGGSLWSINLYPNGTGGAAVTVTGTILNGGFVVQASRYWPVIYLGGVYYVFNGFEFM